MSQFGGISTGAPTWGERGGALPTSASFRRESASARNVDRLLAAARHGTRVTLLIRGEAGQGKTTLLAAVATRAEESGVVVTLEGHAAERDIPYAGIRALLMTYVSDALDASPMQGMIRALVTDFVPPQSPLAVCGAVSVWLGCLAPAGSCLICVDDADKVDEESMRVLSYVAARLPAGQIALVCTATTVVPLLDRIGATQLMLDDLDDAAAHSLLRTCGVRRENRAAIIARLGGNPLALSFAGQAVASSAAAALHESEPAPLHQRLEEDIRARLGDLPRATAYLLEAAAVSRSDDLGALSAWSEQRQFGVADALLPPAEDAGLVTTEFDRLRWRRPWIAEAIVRLCPPGRRERLRSQLLSLDPATPRQSLVSGQLTQAEARVARAVINGASNRQAAEQLSLSEKTIDSHLQHIYRKLSIRSRSQLVASLLVQPPASGRSGGSTALSRLIGGK